MSTSQDMQENGMNKRLFLSISKDIAQKQQPHIQ